MTTTITTTTTTGYTLEHVHGRTYKCVALKGVTLDEDMQYHISLNYGRDGFVDAGDWEPVNWAGAPVGLNTRAELLTLTRQAIREAAKGGAEDICIRFCELGIDVWMDAEAIADAGGPVAWVESNCDLDEYQRELVNNHDYEVVDDEGGIVGAFCDYSGCWGSCDWKGLKEAMEVSVPAAVLVAGLEAGLDVDMIEDAYMGEWEDDEAMAYDWWDETGMLESVPEAARGYIDWAMVARDMLMSGIVESKGHYFHQF